MSKPRNNMVLSPYDWPYSLKQEMGVYDYYIISIGSGGEALQQLPPFVAQLAEQNKKLFVLNIDPNFFYPVDKCDKVKNVPSNITLRYSNIPFENNGVLTRILNEFLKTSANVIVLSHLSPHISTDLYLLAYQHGDKLQDQLNIIISYHKGQPCLVVNKDFVMNYTQHRLRPDPQFTDMVNDLFLTPDKDKNNDDVRKYNKCYRGRYGFISELSLLKPEDLIEKKHLTYEDALHNIHASIKACVAPDDIKDKAVGYLFSEQSETGLESEIGSSLAAIVIDGRRILASFLNQEEKLSYMDMLQKIQVSIDACKAPSGIKDKAMDYLLSDKDFTEAELKPAIGESLAKIVINGKDELKHCNTELKLEPSRKK